MGRSAGNMRIKKKLLESLKQVEDPDKFQIDEIIDFYNDDTKFIKKAKLAHASLKKYDFKNLHNKFSEILKKI